MRRCCRGAALALGGVLMTSLPSLNSCSLGSLTVYAAEDALTEELETAFQEDVLTGESNVETDIPAEETANEPAMEETEPAGTVTELAPVSESGSGLEDQEYQILQIGRAHV